MGEGQQLPTLSAAHLGFGWLLRLRVERSQWFAIEIGAIERVIGEQTDDAENLAKNSHLRRV